MALRIGNALVGDLYKKAGAERWQVPIDRFRLALEASAAKTFTGQSPSDRDLERYLQSLRLDELALACACAEGNESAWDHFVLQYRPILYRAADAIDATGGARELADALYADLFRSLFRYFHGRSSLATWLRAVLAQRHVDGIRARAKTTPLAELDPAAPETVPPDPERNRYLAVFHAAFLAAVARLDPRDRLRLGYYYAQGLTLAESGRLLHEHEASVSRHLAAARKAIRRDVEQHLRDAAGLGPDEIAQCFESVTGDTGPFDVRRLLGDAGARSPGSIVQRGRKP